ncbi:MAG TPA: hypothetical protein VHM90_16680 [Phycisphaerae bacterium]|nr:hypothetical protein [Phycisphaerae bacterium]
MEAKPVAAAQEYRGPGAGAADGAGVTPTDSTLPIIRTRIALALIAAVVVGLELSLMRGLAIRFSSHFAGIVISLGLLGFGAAGSFLTLLRRWVIGRQRALLVFLALALAATIPLTWWLAQEVPLDINYLSWTLLKQHGEAPHVLAIELLMLVPFTFAGAFIGIALMDAPPRLNGHYAADLLGSGAGGVIAVLAMNGFSPAQLQVGQSAAALMAAILLLHWRRAGQWIALVTALLLTGGALSKMPWEPAANPYKPLAYALQLAGTQIVYRGQSPLGRIDVVAGPALHSAPQLSLQYYDDLPPHMEMYTDGDGQALIYDCKKTEDWSFCDYRTAAAAFNLVPRPPARVCIVDAGGGVEIGTALLHHSPDITALQPNPQIIRAMTGPLAARGGSVYAAPGVHVINQEPRGFFASAPGLFDIIQFPPIGGFGAAGADATRESYDYTARALRDMLRHLAPGGVLALTRGIDSPPRTELRAFNLAAESLRQENLDPAPRLAMIRGDFSCTILVFRDPISDAQLAALRAFCRRMSFDVCYFPGITDQDANPVLATRHVYGNYNLVDHPYYFTGPQALLGPLEVRQNFIAQYPFELAAPGDSQPYFFHMFRWSFYGELQRKHGEGVHRFLEVSFVMLLVAVVQALALAAILILLPLAPGINTLRQTQRKTSSLAYFLMIGLGFMFLEMAFVQKLALYLAHPIYAAAVVIASFLVFAGLGSQYSKSWPTPDRTVRGAAIAICIFGIGFLLALDPWLSLTQSWNVAARCAIAACTIAPLSFAMGNFFPLGLTRTAESQPAVVPWAWAINGFASVLAASAAPLLAMQFGFSWLVIIAMSCYILACVIFPRMATSK